MTGNPWMDTVTVQTGPWKPPIEVGNVKSKSLPKFIYFSSSFIVSLGLYSGSRTKG
jgi:hypothetical protein